MRSEMEHASMGFTESGSACTVMAPQRSVRETPAPPAVSAARARAAGCPNRLCRPTLTSATAG